MYKSIAKELIENTLKKANEWALKERANFQVYAEIIEEYSQNHTLIAGEQTGIDLMLGRKFHIDSYPYTFYSKDPEADGYNIADIMYEKTKYEYIMVNSHLDGTEVMVKIADRVMAKILYLDEYKGISMVELSDPIIHDGWFNRHISCININVQLARIYRQMSSPAYVTNWEKLLKDEEQMLVIYRPAEGGDIEEEPKSDNISNEYCCGGYEKEYFVDDEDNEFVTAGRENKDNFVDPRDDALNIIKKEILGKNEVVIISDRNKKLQIAGMDSIELEEQLKQLFGSKINKVTQLPKIPGEERLRRYTYYYTPAEKKYPLIDLFNIAEYDPIPQKNGHAHRLVILRIIIVDIWTLKLIKALGQIDENFANKRIAELTAEYSRVRGNDQLNLDILHEGYTYVGVMDQDRYAKSKIIRKTRNQSEIYFPYNEYNKVKGGEKEDTMYTPASRPAESSKGPVQTFAKFPSMDISGGHCKIKDSYGLDLMSI